MKRKIFIPILLSFLFLLQSFGTALAVEAQTNENSSGEFDPYMKGTLLSGQVTEVPWQNDSSFLEAKEKYHCPVLMAAYKTVLKDPLPGEEANVHLAAKYISGAVIEPGKVFSQNKTAGPYTSDRGYSKGPTYAGTTFTETIGGGVCKIASTMFNVAILSNLQVTERHTHNMPVPYVPYGQDATVCYGAKDLKFKNNTDSPVMIWAQGIDNVLYIALYGNTVPPIVKWDHEVTNVVKAPVYRQKNGDLPPNTEKITHEGMDGAVIRSKITITYPDGTSEVKNMGKVYYNPLPWIKEISG